MADMDGTEPQETQGGGVALGTGAVAGGLAGLGVSQMLGKSKKIPDKLEGAREALLTATKAHENKLDEVVPDLRDSEKNPDWIKNRKLESAFDDAKDILATSKRSHNAALADFFDTEIVKQSPAKQGELAVARLKGELNYLQGLTSHDDGVALLIETKKAELEATKERIAKGFKKIKGAAVDRELSDVADKAASDFRRSMDLSFDEHHMLDDAENLHFYDLQKAGREAMAKDSDLSKAIATATNGSGEKLKKAEQEFKKAEAEWKKVTSKAAPETTKELEKAAARVTKFEALEKLNGEKGVFTIVKRPFKLLQHGNAWEKLAVVGTTATVAIGTALLARMALNPRTPQPQAYTDRLVDQQAAAGQTTPARGA